MYLLLLYTQNKPKTIPIRANFAHKTKFEGVDIGAKKDFRPQLYWRFFGANIGLRCGAPQ